MGTHADDEGRTVSLSVPANADYLVLARLALSAVCRLTPLDPDDVVDLKLAVTEAATGVLTARAAAGEEDRIAFDYRLGDDRLTLEVRGALHPVVSEEDQQLGRAIIEATVDEYSEEGDAVRLVKYLDEAGG